MAHCVVTLLLLLSAACSTVSTRVNPKSVSRETVFYIDRDQPDPIGVAAVIVDVLSKRGHRVDLRPPPKVDVQKDRSASGTAFYISESLLVTNHHLIDNADRVIVRTDAGDSVEAEVVVSDQKNDLALLRVPLGLTDRWFGLVGLSEATIGDPVTVAGFPLTTVLGTNPRLTEGIVSASVGLLDDPTRLQISAPIQPGNSGGPIFNENFKVIGVVSERLSDQYAIGLTGAVPQNVNFGIKADYAMLLVDQITGSNLAPSNIFTFKDAIAATAHISTGSSQAKSTSPASSRPIGPRNVLISFSYSHVYDLIHYTLQRLSIQWTDTNTGEVIATGSFSGDSFRSYGGIVRKVLEEVLVKAGG